ncbi:outer arm dynein light chain 1 [Gonapodya prolifera JEL478]|uniref:Outer arm dynein light chain 1 n=1 Tax=Gonapodya prolifera (strain JEL478) TaxID=1344416 RepID=A0A139ALA8_GONPJ|nr:outer arm dynein light chain 1 [Gonapodya prolifera JEL478]|eukprot:KXS17572.1 outer arm dynein light chain 1 [Gonapodya prolifera JEL478]
MPDEPKTQRIDKQLLLRRAEHNDGELSSLKEITLHQFDIEKIENLDVYCRNLEILYLQNNQIGRIGASPNAAARSLSLVFTSQFPDSPSSTHSPPAHPHHSENLHKLKQLRYLNLALNNICRIENLSRCESLEKLDLTVNFVDDLLDVEELIECRQLKELYLIGNPCSSEQGYRKFVIATLPQLKTLDTTTIEKSERIAALQDLPSIRARLVRERDQKKQSHETEGEQPVGDARPHNEPAPTVEPGTAATEHESNETTPDTTAQDPAAVARHSFQTTTTSHTPESRLKIARELAQIRSESAPSSRSKQPAPTSTPSLFGPDGRVLRRNEGKWPFSFSETPATVILRVDLPKFLDSSLLDLDVHPTWLRLTVKGKILQLVLDQEVRPDDVLAERSKHSGSLAVTMRKAGGVVGAVGEGDVEAVRRREREQEEEERRRDKEAERVKAEKEKEARSGATRRMKLLKSSATLGDAPSSAVNYRTIVQHASDDEESSVKPAPRLARAGVGVKEGMKAGKIQDRRILHDFDITQETFEENPDVPPLE